MKNSNIRRIVIVVCALVSVSMAVAAQQDRYTVKALDGVSFAEFKGYENWQDVAVSRTGTDVKAILANPVMIKAFRDGIPGNGKPFPDGSKIVKVEWLKKANPLSPYPVEIPDQLQALAFIEKDSKRFPETSGWGYAQFDYDAKAGTFSAYGKDANFGKTYCYATCHTKVKDTDYIFTAYPFR
jgi:hypothetical protein